MSSFTAKTEDIQNDETGYFTYKQTTHDSFESPSGRRGIVSVLSDGHVGGDLLYFEKNVS